MSTDQQKKILIDYLNMKVLQQDWRAVADTANDLRAMGQGISIAKPVEGFTPVPLQAIPPVDIEIQHHVNEVKSLLKLSDEDLVDKMFPDLSQQAEG